MLVLERRGEIRKVVHQQVLRVTLDGGQVQDSAHREAMAKCADGLIALARGEVLSGEGGMVKVHTTRIW